MRMEPRPDDIDQERSELLDRLEAWLEVPMVVLAFLWVGLLVIEFAFEPAAWLFTIATGIWIVFILDFLLRLVVAPAKGRFLKRNWLTAVSLLLPALRIFRVFAVLRFLRFSRGLRLIRVVSSINRTMRALGDTMQRRGFGYVVVLSIIVTFAGAAGMLAFEKDVSHPNGLHSYGGSLWWTAMIITTMGSDYWPQTVEGRVLCLLLALYAFAVFGYVAGTVASFFIDRDAESDAAEIAGRKSLEALRAEIAALRQQLQSRPPEKDFPAGDRSSDV